MRQHTLQRFLLSLCIGRTLPIERQQAFQDFFGCLMFDIRRGEFEGILACSACVASGGSYVFVSYSGAMAKREQFHRPASADRPVLVNQRIGHQLPNRQHGVVWVFYPI